MEPLLKPSFECSPQTIHHGGVRGRSRADVPAAFGQVVGFLAAMTGIVLLVAMGPAVQAAAPAAAASATEPAPEQRAVSLPRIFADHMVLQRDMPVSIWGWAPAGEKLTLTFGTQSKTAPTDATGRWHVSLDPMPAQATGQDLLVVGSNTVVLRDVLVGEVWLCAGQSNMCTRVSENPKEIVERESPKTDWPSLRLFGGAGSPMRTVPQKDLETGQWSASTLSTARPYSGVAYFFGRELHTALGVPVGLIMVGCGGSASECWTSEEGLEKDPHYQNVLKPYWEQTITNHDKIVREYEEKLVGWKQAVAKANAEGVQPPKRPGRGVAFSRCPTFLFNGLVAPLAGVTVRGVIWYQGESNSDSVTDSMMFRTLLPTMINDWRTQWQRDDLPFYFVQLANFGIVQTEPVEHDNSWALSRENQALALALPNTGMVTAIDINDEPRNIHPPNKYDVGIRLAKLALAKTYGKAVAYAGPAFENMTVAGATVRLAFSHADGGLKTRDGGPVKGFAIAGTNGRYVWADARIEGNVVVLSSSEVPHPVHVRYAWASNPIGNLSNGAGLPAFPFRTDTEQELFHVPGNSAITRKLDGIMIPTIDFRDTPVREALEFLEQQAAAQDTQEPDAFRKGLKIFLKLKPEAPHNAALVSLSLSNVSLRNAIDQAAAAAKLRVTLLPSGVLLRP